MSPMEFFLAAVLPVFGYNVTFIVFVVFVSLFMLLAMLGMNRGLMFVALMGFVVIFSAFAPGFSWLIWVFTAVAIVLVFVGLKILLSRIF